MKKGYSKKKKPVLPAKQAPPFRDCSRCGLNPGSVMVKGKLIKCPVCRGKGKVRNK